MKPYQRKRLDVYKQVISWENLAVTSKSSPRVKGRIKEVFNPFSMSWSKGNNTTFVYRMGRDYYWDGPGGITGYNSASAPHIATENEINNFKISFLNELNGESANLVDLVRTRKETISMVSSNAMSIAKSIRFLRKGKLRRAMNALGITKEPKSKTAANRWLEMQYGWLPLLGDIHTLANGTFSDPVCSLKRTRRFTKNVTNDVGRSYPVIHEVTRFQQTKVRFGCKFTIDAPALAAADQIGLLNPTITAWEAVPWSFVVDWFLPVGDYLESLTALKGIKIIEFYQSVSSIEDVSWKAKLSPSSGYISVSGGSGASFARRKDRFRSDTSVKFPSFKNPLSLGHFYNAMALLRTSFKR